ncbi:uncharacterized protein [Macrobrachium rosenbergii]|uniref:uncharacterized protein n=1 Tax=Macrobrachium rosenbergii TaxID=79674 RepID=UPI0034D4B7D7
MSELETLVKKRGGHKSVISSWLKKMEAIIADGDANTIYSLGDLISKQWKIVQELDEKILALTNEDGQVDEMIKQSDYEMNIGVHIRRMSTAVTNIQGRNPSQPTLPVTTGIRLPKLDLPHYKGDVLEWSTFWELFNVSVHQRSDLEPIQKFSYLRSILEGEALTLISGFKLESDKYHQAVKLLQSTYGKKDEIKLCLVKRLLETESPNADAESLQNFRANFECSIRSLESENLDLNELYTILLYTKLPRNISEVVKRRSGDDWLKFDTFKKYLEEEIHNLKVFNPMETREPGTLSSVSTFTINQAQSVRPKTKNLKINVNKSGSNQRRECALCEGEHWWTQCKTYANREKKLNRLGLCDCVMCVRVKQTFQCGL